MLLTTITLTPKTLVGHAPTNEAIRDACDSDNVLWARSDRDELTVASEISPEWEVIPGAISAHSSRYPTHPTGAMIEWRILAAPVKRFSRRDRHGHAVGKPQKKPLPDAEVVPWITGKLAPGLRVTTAGHRRMPTSSNFAARWLITGEGEVLDGQELRDIALAGLGTQRAQGCGLLLTWKL